MLTIAYVFKLSYLKWGDEILRVSSILLALELISQAIHSFQNSNIEAEKLRPFFIFNSLVLLIEMIEEE